MRLLNFFLSAKISMTSLCLTLAGLICALSLSFCGRAKGRFSTTPFSSLSLFKLLQGWARICLAVCCTGHAPAAYDDALILSFSIWVGTLFRMSAYFNSTINIASWIWFSKMMLVGFDGDWREGGRDGTSFLFFLSERKIIRKSFAEEIGESLWKGNNWITSSFSLPPHFSECLSGFPVWTEGQSWSPPCYFCCSHHTWLLSLWAIPVWGPRKT